MKKRKEKIIQFGEGNFLRAFADWMVQILNEKTDFNASAVVVQPIPKGMCDLLTAQDCRYTHIMRGEEGVERRTIDVISRCINPYDDFAAYLQLAENPDFRFVISNTTEAGISYRKEDRPNDRPPVSFPAKVTLLLRRRFDLGYRGFVFLPCELIENNGKELKRMVLQYAKTWNFPHAFWEWIEKENVFCSTLVDRIVSGRPKDEKIETDFPDALTDISEYYHFWAIEGSKNLLQEIPFDKAGLNVTVTDHLAPYRTRKVRILNGAHTALVFHALLSGFQTVKDCMDDPQMSAFLRSCVFDEILPSLDLPEEELICYAKEVFRRFSNPYLNHQLSSIALNSVSKFRVRVLPSILEYQKRFAKLPPRLVFSFAKLIQFYQTQAPVDSPEVIAFMKQASTREILKNQQLWGQNLEFLWEEVMQYANTSTR